MNPEKLHFRCPGCQKNMAVAAIHAGRLIACPNCKKKLRLPSLPGSKVKTSSAATGQPSTPVGPSQDAIPATTQAQPAQAQPAQAQPAQAQPAQAQRAPRAQRTVNAPSHVEPQHPVHQHPEHPSPGEVDPLASPFSVPEQTVSDPTAGAGPDPQPSALAVGQGYQKGSPAAEQARKQAAAEAAKAAAAPPDPTIGRSIGGLVVATAVAAFFCLIWILLELFTSGAMGMLAWALGGLIGLVAGSIARNPSTRFCAMVGILAVSVVVMAKSVMALGVMLAATGMSMAEDMMADMPGNEKKLRIIADDMLDQGTLVGARKEYAEAFTENYFSGDEDDFYELVSDDALEIEEEFLIELRQRLKETDDATYQQMLAGVRSRHPMWIEDTHHYQAILDAMYQEPESLNPEQKKFVRAELSVLNDDGYGASYYQSKSSDEISRNRDEVRKLVAQRLSQMDQAAIDQAVRQTMKTHENWNPFPDATVAVTALMHEEGAFEGPLADQVAADLASHFNDDDGYDEDYYENINWDLIDRRQQEIGKLVTARVVEMDKAQRDALVAETAAEHPLWLREEMSDEERLEVISEQLGDFGDGTFISSLGVVIGWLDFLWISLAGSSAFGTARKLGTVAPLSTA